MTPCPDEVEHFLNTSSKISLETCFYIIAISLFIRILCIGCNDLLVEEAYYWNYAAHLDFSYLDHPPMVALLIKLSTTLLGTNEFAVRAPTLVCWLLAAFFSYKLTSVITSGAGLYAVLILAILPFFFLHSLVITPDQPLIVCWSASLYCLYRSMVFAESRYWYAMGLCLGLGMLSKYTIVLLGPATLIYLLIVPEARFWFKRKEPYIGVLIALIIFTPVIYWNAKHEWVSFLFQTTRRFNSETSFSLHQVIALLIFFLMPVGMIDFVKLFKKNAHISLNMDVKSKRFFQVFTLVPLSFFGLFSLTHGVKFNWIGPSLLALIPWLALLIHQATHKPTTVPRLHNWLFTAALLLIAYSCFMFSVTFGRPEAVHKLFFKKYIAWGELTQQVHDVAKRIETEADSIPVIVPLDLYNIGSELAFYQAKLLAQGKIDKTYSIIGRHIFGVDSLMYRYWSKDYSPSGKTLILISTIPGYLDWPQIKEQAIEKSPVNILWSHSQGKGEPITPYYYRVVEMKPSA